MMRSPPPPVPQSAQPTHLQPHGSYSYQQSGMGQQVPANSATAGPSFHPAYGGFINDSTAQLGLQVGQNAMAAGQQIVNDNFNKYINVNALKHYFNVTTSYVLSKLLLVLFPWRHRSWVRRTTQDATFSPNLQQSPTDSYLAPRDDINSPDMYIPVMGFVTYILISATLQGLRGSFDPALFGGIASTAFAIMAAEILLLKLGCYLLSIQSDSQWLDLVAYSGYKFVGVIVTLLLAEIVTQGKGTGGWIGWTVFLYTFSANAFFLLRSLKYVLLPENRGADGMQTVARNQRNKRTQFLFAYAYLYQFACMLFLTTT